MRYFAYIGIILFLLTGCGGDDGKTLSTDLVKNPKTASGKEDLSDLPVITFDKDVHDFGKVTQGEKVTYNFRFTNTGKSDLLITSVNTSCGCTASEFPRDPIKPGDGGMLRVTFDSEGRRGVQNKTITVVSNCQPDIKVLRIKAMVVTPK
jgi:hypothetical protein